MTLTLFEFLTYFCSGIVCLLLAIVLFGIKNGTSEAARKFVAVKHFVAAASFLDVIVDVVVIWLMAQKADYMSVNYVFAPMIFFFQLYMGAASLLSLFRFPRLKDIGKSVFRFFVPVVSVVLLHYIVYACKYGIGFDASSYSEYVTTPLALSISIVLYIVIVVEAVCLGVWMVKAVRRYNRLLMDYYSGNEIVRGRRLTSVNLAFFLYFALALANMASRNTVVSAVAICVTTSLFVVFAISLINLQRLFSVLSPAFTYEERPVAETSCPVQPEPADGESRETGYGETAPANIDRLVKKWSSDPSKPYLRDGITVAAAAEEMGIGCRILSDFLNSIYGMNFNSWINGLRIEEVMHILEKSPMTPVSHIAVMTGFADASACSKTFRKFAGMTISQYRESLK